MKCSITKQIVTDNKVIIHVVLDRAHIPGTLNGCHGLGRSILSVTLNGAVMTRECEKVLFLKTLRVLSVLLITVSTRMPVAQSKLPPPLSPLLAADILSSNWILAFTDTRVEPPPAIAPPPQWAAPSCNGLCEPT